MITMKKQILILLILTLFSFSAETTEKLKFDKKKEEKLQIGFGISINSPDIKTGLDIIEKNKKIKTGKEYSYPGLNEKQKESIQELDTWMQKALLSAYTFRTMEYTIQTRVLWRFLIAENDLTILPADYSYSDKSNIHLSYMIGIRYPYFLMPYIITGPVFTLGFNPDSYTNTDGNYINKINALCDSIYFRAGLIFKTGLELKFKIFSTGIYYQYKIKNFDEFNYWKDQYESGKISIETAFIDIFGQQSRFGMSINFYISRKNKK